jgi:hypothetical protein
MVLMANGDARRVGDVRIGDKLLGADGQVRNVARRVDGNAPMFRVKYGNVRGAGERQCWFDCNGPHQLVLALHCAHGVIGLADDKHVLADLDSVTYGYRVMTMAMRDTPEFTFRVPVRRSKTFLVDESVFEHCATPRAEALAAANAKLAELRRTYPDVRVADLNRPYRGRDGVGLPSLGFVIELPKGNARLAGDPASYFFYTQKSRLALIDPLITEYHRTPASALAAARAFSARCDTTEMLWEPSVDQFVAFKAACKDAAGYCFVFRRAPPAMPLLPTSRPTFSALARSALQEALDNGHVFDATLVTMEELAWFVGAWLGDGYAGKPAICCSDPYEVGSPHAPSSIALRDAVRRIAVKLRLAVVEHRSAANDMPNSHGSLEMLLSIGDGARSVRHDGKMRVLPGQRTKNACNPITLLLERLGVFGVGGNKPVTERVFEAFLRERESVRAALIAGCIDTDGSQHTDGTQYRFSQGDVAAHLRVGAAHTHLHYSIALLFHRVVLSLGYHSNLCRGEPRQLLGTTTYECRVTVSVPEEADIIAPYIVMARKRGRVPPTESGRDHGRWLRNKQLYNFAIEPLAANAFVGLTVDGDQRFLLADYLVVHNCVIDWYVVLHRAHLPLRTGVTTDNVGSAIGPTWRFSRLLQSSRATSISTMPTTCRRYRSMCRLYCSPCRCVLFCSRCLPCVRHIARAMQSAVMQRDAVLASLVYVHSTIQGANARLQRTQVRRRCGARRGHARIHAHRVARITSRRDTFSTSSRSL